MFVSVPINMVIFFINWWSQRLQLQEMLKLLDNKGYTVNFLFNQIAGCKKLGFLPSHNMPNLPSTL